MAEFPTVRVPAYEFYFNLVVCPLQGSTEHVSEAKMEYHI